MISNVCFEVSFASSSSGSCSSLIVTDLIRKHSVSVESREEIHDFSLMDQRFFFTTQSYIVSLRLDSPWDLPLIASLDVSAPDFLMFRHSQSTESIQIKDHPYQMTHVSSKSRTGDILLAGTYSRLFLIDQRTNQPRLYRIFDESVEGVVQLQMPEIERIKKMASGVDHIVMLTEDGKVYTFGTGSRGELGTGGVVSEQEPVEVELPDDVTVQDLAVGNWHTVALTDSNDVYVWGWNRDGQLGEVEDKCVYTPFPLDIDDVIAVDAKECTTVLTTRDELGQVVRITYGRLVCEEQD